ncbi:MAG TPA: S53 family peptidase [Streptosporangiaceae bacterium]|nr:S53 family peptidase [Streptosporangiaceae bacterium]
MGSRRVIRFLTVFAGLAAMTTLAALPLGGTGRTAAAAAPQAGLQSRMVPAISVDGQPLVQKIAGPDRSGTFFCQTVHAVEPCYGPAQIRAAYDIPANLTGAGRTIVIIDAFRDPTIRTDLARFDSTFGLPAAPFNIICPGQHCPTFDPTSADQVGWTDETSLDVEWAHAIAPRATIDLVLAQSDADSDILAAQQYVVDHDLGDVVSQSFSEGETCMVPPVRSAEHQAFVLAEREQMSVFAAAGDSGAAQYGCVGYSFFMSAGVPASDPLVTGVGGTHLNASITSGAYHGETVWNNSGDIPDFGAGGGGFSTVYPRPSYQDAAHTGSGFRGVPDVAYDADVYGGVIGVCSECNFGVQSFAVFGGTSAGTPQWAAIAALADQAAGHRLGLLNPALYAIAASSRYHDAFHDITTGNNSWDISLFTGYQARRGWDPASGLGSPNAAHLIKLLAGRS